MLKYNALTNDIVNENDRVKVTHEMMKGTLLWQKENVAKLGAVFKDVPIHHPTDPEKKLNYEGVIDLLIACNFEEEQDDDLK